MNKKGFTLTELIAVIAILGILAVIATPAVLLIRKNVLSNTLDSKINQIISAAEDYGSRYIMEIPSYVNENCNDGANCCCLRKCNDGANCSLSSEKFNDGADCYLSGKCYLENDDCLIVLVRSLISHGYLAGDSENKEILVNPIDGSSLNSERVCIRYDNNNAMKRKIFAYIVNEDDLRDWNNERYK